MQVLTPSVEHRQEADGSAQEPGIGGGLDQGARRGPEQNRVDLLCVLKSQRPIC